MRKLIFFPSSLVLCLLIVVGCQRLFNSKMDCEPGHYYPVEGPVLESFALVTCADGKTYDIIPRTALAVVPTGGVHTLYMRTKPDWELPAQLPEDVGQVFAGSCPLELSGLSCIPEFNGSGFPAQSNALSSTLSIVDSHTLKIQFELPDEPRQVSVKLNICHLWQSDEHCIPEGKIGNVGAEFGYGFRYETINHIKELQPGVECNC